MARNYSLSTLQKCSTLAPILIYLCALLVKNDENGHYDNCGPTWLFLTIEQATTSSPDDPSNYSLITFCWRVTFGLASAVTLASRSGAMRHFYRHNYDFYKEQAELS